MEQNQSLWMFFYEKNPQTSFHEIISDVKNKKGNYPNFCFSNLFSYHSPLCAAHIFSFCFSPVYMLFFPNAVIMVS